MHIATAAVPPAYAPERGARGFDIAVVRLQSALSALDAGNDVKASSSVGGSSSMFAGALTSLRYNRPGDTALIAAVNEATEGAHTLAVHMRDARRPSDAEIRTSVNSWLDVARAGAAALRS